MQDGKIIGYHLVTEVSEEALCTQVNIMMNDEWEPFGGIATSVSICSDTHRDRQRSDFVLAQAMVKRDRR